MIPLLSKILTYGSITFKTISSIYSVIKLNLNLTEEIIHSISKKKIRFHIISPNCQMAILQY